LPTPRKSPPFLKGSSSSLIFYFVAIDEEWRSTIADHYWRSVKNASRNLYSSGAQVPQRVIIFAPKLSNTQMKLSENQNFPKQIQREYVPGRVHACKEKDFPGGYMHAKRKFSRASTCKENIFSGGYMHAKRKISRAGTWKEKDFPGGYMHAKRKFSRAGPQFVTSRSQIFHRAALVLLTRNKRM
jgi:hypothetical protein